MVSMKVGTDFRMNARRFSALPADVRIFTVHGIHVCTWSAEVAKIAFEIWHSRNGFHLSQDALLRAAHDKFSLMCRDGAESTAAEAATVEIDREFYHLESRDGLPLVFRVRQTRIRKVEGMVNLLLRHWWEHDIADDIAFSAIGR